MLLNIARDRTGARVPEIRPRIILFFGFVLALAAPARAQDKPSAPWNESRYRVLLVVAHPDDESEMAGTIYRLTKELSGVVDQVIVSDGEGGFRYAVAVADLRMSPGNDMFTLPRLTVRAGIGVAGLARLLSTPPTLRRRAVSRARRAASRAVRRVVPIMGSRDAREGPASE